MEKLSKVNPLKNNVMKNLKQINPLKNRAMSKLMIIAVFSILTIGLEAQDHSKAPALKKNVGNITAKDVISHYFKAIGGRDKISKIQSVKKNYHSSMQGQDFEITLLTAATNKMSEIVKLISSGIVVSKFVFDGEKGYQESPQGKKDLDEKRISELKAENALFSQLAYINPTLKGISQLNGHEVYEIQEGNSTEYYNIQSGLLEKVVREIETAQKKQLSVTTILDDYKEVNGIKIPHTQTQIMNSPGLPDAIRKLTLKSIEFNVKTTKADFQ